MEHASDARSAGGRGLATINDVATYLQIPPKTLHRWRSMGEGPPALKIGKHLRYRWGDVEAWLETRADPRRDAGRTLGR